MHTPSRVQPWPYVPLRVSWHFSCSTMGAWVWKMPIPKSWKARGQCSSFLLLHQTTKLGSTRHNFASGLSFCSVRIKLQQLYSIEINVRHSKAALTFGIWAGTPWFTWGKHWAASSLELCLLHNKQTRAYLAFRSLGGRRLSPDAAPVASH